MLSHTIPYIYYSPIITSYASLLLVYVTESRCFEILENMISLSNERKDVLNKFFTLDAEQFKTLVGIACKMIFETVEGLKSYIEAKNIDFCAAVADMIKNFFIGYFKLPFLSRTLLWVLCEGNKAIVKVLVGIFKTLSENFSEFRSLFINDLKSCCYHADDDETIFKTALKVKIPKNYNENLELPNLQNLSSFVYKRPKCSFSSKLISICELELVWSSIPHLFSHCNIEMLFSTEKDGFSLRALLRKTANLKKSTPFILLIHTVTHEIIGVFIDNAISPSEAFIGSNYSFIFTLRPKPALYFSSGKNEMFAHISETIMIFGGGSQGCALTIDKQLLQCTSSPCETFNSPILITDSFNLLALELICLVA